MAYDWALFDLRVTSKSAFIAALQAKPLFQVGIGPQSGPCRSHFRI